MHCMQGRLLPTMIQLIFPIHGHGVPHGELGEQQLRSSVAWKPTIFEVPEFR